ncbi:hypothetical protein GCM10022405_27130 [Gibbsiella dentisursi]|uniref:Uncharacterized protein n=1 Tax=Gibbsiella dentisursi TaxID=796890 RepID=A0ABP7LIP8_9GAMM
MGAGYANSIRATTPEFSVSLVAVFSPNGNDQYGKHPSTYTLEAVKSTISLYRDLFNHLNLHELTSTQLLDLAALSAEQSEGLCNGLLLFIEPLQKTHGPAHLTKSS